MADVATLGIRVDSSQASRAAGDLDRLAASGSRTDQSINRLADAHIRLMSQVERLLVPMHAFQSILWPIATC
jgi:hypothetical protein